jgi:hypothetical protein
MFSARDENVRCRIRALNKLLGFDLFEANNINANVQQPIRNVLCKG